MMKYVLIFLTIVVFLILGYYIIYPDLGEYFGNLSKYQISFGFWGFFKAIFYIFICVILLWLITKVKSGVMGLLIIMIDLLVILTFISNHYRDYYLS